MAASEELQAADEFVLEQTLFQESGVWFYQVPAGQVTTLSPRADSWDPEHPFLTGSLQILQKGEACWIKLFEPTKQSTDDDISLSLSTSAAAQRTLFAQCPIEITRELPLDVYVQDCVDSSRYFMIRVEDEETKRRAYVGIGFPERASAFNFKASLQDYAKYALRQIEAAALSSLNIDDNSADGNASGSSSGAPSPGQKSQAFSLSEGQTMRINLKLNNLNGDNTEKLQRRRNSSGGDGNASGPVKIPMIPPPPGDLTPSSTVEAVPKTAQTQAASVVAGDDEDWGDFTSA